MHRPSGLAVGPDGALYISDDKAGRIWRVTYNGDPNAPGSRRRRRRRNRPKPRPVRSRRRACIPTPVIAGCPPGATAEQVALGKKIFHGEVAGATCAGCHGADGIGTPVGADLQSGTWLWGDGSLQSITDIIKTGVPKPKATSGRHAAVWRCPLVRHRPRRCSCLRLGYRTSEDSVAAAAVVHRASGTLSSQLVTPPGRSCTKKHTSSESFVGSGH